MYTLQLLYDHGDTLMWPWEKLVHQETSPPNALKGGGGGGGGVGGKLILLGSK